MCAKDTQLKNFQRSIKDRAIYFFTG